MFAETPSPRSLPAAWGVAWHRYDAAEAGEAVGGCRKRCHVVAGGGQELGAEDDAMPDMLVKPGLDELVGFRDLLVERHHLSSQRVHQLRGRPLSEEAGGLDGLRGELTGVANAAVMEPGRQALCAEPMEGCWRLVAGQQGERSGVGEVQRPFQTGEDA